MNFGETIKSQKAAVLADQVVVSGSAFLTNLLLARVLGLEGFGRYATVGLAQLFFLSLSLGALMQVYQVVYPALAPDKQPLYTKGLVWTQVLFLIVIAFAGLILFWWQPRWLAAYQDLAMAGLAASVLYLLQDCLRKVLLTQQKGHEALLCDALTNGLQIVLLALAWYLHWLTAGNAWWVVGLTFIPSILLAFVFIKPGVPTAEGFQLVWDHHRLKAPWLLASSVLQWGTGYFFVMAAGFWIGAAALGALRLAQYIFGLLNVVLQAIENYTLPRAVALQSDASFYLQNLLKKSLLIMAPVLLVLVVFARPIMALAGGAQYAGYAYIIYGLSVVYLLITIGTPLRVAIRSQHLNQAYFTGYILSLFFSLSAAQWLLQNWKLYGVLAGLLGTQVITLSYWYFAPRTKKFVLWKSFT